MSRSRVWTVGTAVAVAAILALGWFLLISPKKSEAKDLKVTAADTIEANQNTEQTIRQLKLEQKQLPDQQAKIEKIHQQLPKSPLQPSLIRQITNAAEDADVDLVSLTPSPLAPLTTDPTVAYMSLTISAKGDFTHLKAFLFALEENKRALLVSGFTIAPSQDDPKVLAMTTTARAFVSSDAPATTGTAGAATGSVAGTAQRGTATDSAATSNSSSSSSSTTSDAK